MEDELGLDFRVRVRAFRLNLEFGILFWVWVRVKFVRFSIEFLLKIDLDILNILYYKQIPEPKTEYILL